MTLVAGKVFEFNIVKKEESDMWKRTHGLEVQTKAKETHKKLKTTINKQQDLHGLLKRIWEEEENELKVFPPEAPFELSALTWRSKDRVKRFKKLSKVVFEITKTVKDFQESLEQLPPLLKGRALRKFTRKKKKYEKLCDLLQVQLHFFTVFLQVYEKTNTADQVIDYLRKLAKHHRRKKPITPKWLNSQIKALRESFEALQTATKDLREEFQALK